jgi:hypothetical protein
MSKARDLMEDLKDANPTPGNGPDKEMLHKFERAGLGKGPFRFIGARENWYSAGPGHKQPGGSCDFCGNGIANEFWFKSADGKQFKVGSECFHKSGDKVNVSAVHKAKVDMDRDKRHAREKAKLEIGEPLFMQVLAAAKDKPHPNDYFAKQGKTLADYLEYLWKASGTTGKLKLIRQWVKE